MARPEFKRFSDLGFIQQIDKPKYFRRLLAPYKDYFARQGIDIEALDNTDDSDRKLHRVFTRPDEEMPGALAAALYSIDDLADEAGHDRLLEEAAALEVQLTKEDNLTPGELAIVTYQDNRNVFRRAHDKSLFRKVKNYEEYQAEKDKTLKVPAQAALRELEKRLGAWFGKNMRGEVCEIDAYKEGDEIKFVVSHGRPYRSEGTYDKGLKRSRVTYRPQKHDSVIFDNTTRTLKVNAQTPAERSLYRKEFGEVLFGNADHFPGQNRYTLAPLRDKGADALSLKGVQGISSLRWTEAWIAHFDGEKYVEKHYSVDLVATIKSHGQPTITAGTLIRASVMLKYESGGRARKLEIRPPNVAIYDRQRDATPTEQFLQVNKFLLNGRAAEEPDDGAGEVLDRPGRSLPAGRR